MSVRAPRTWTAEDDATAIRIFLDMEDMNSVTRATLEACHPGLHIREERCRFLNASGFAGASLKDAWVFGANAWAHGLKTWQSPRRTTPLVMVTHVFEDGFHPDMVDIFYHGKGLHFYDVRSYSVRYHFGGGNHRSLRNFTTEVVL